MRLDHPRLLVADAAFAACVRFYRDALGFRVTWGDEGSRYAAFSDREGRDATLALFRRRAMAAVVGTADLPEAGPAAQDRVALIVDVGDGDGGLDATVARLRAGGVAVVAGPRDFPDWGYRGAYVRDPDGTLIELVGHLPPERWSPALHRAARRYRGG